MSADTEAYQLNCSVPDSRVHTDYLVSSLQTGGAIVLLDGSPLFRPEILWKMVDDLGVTVFGTVRSTGKLS